MTLEYAGQPIDFESYLDDVQEEHFGKTFPAECCAKCKFWGEYEYPLFDETMTAICERPVVTYQGSCKRHSPVIEVPVVEKEPSAPCWPEVGYNNWCGDFVSLLHPVVTPGAQDSLLTPHEASDILRLTTRSIVKLARLKKIPHVKLPGDEIRFRKHELFRWVELHAHTEEADQCLTTPPN